MWRQGLVSSTLYLTPRPGKDTTPGAQGHAGLSMSTHPPPATDGSGRRNKYVEIDVGTLQGTGLVAVRDSAGGHVSVFPVDSDGNYSQSRLDQWASTRGAVIAAVEGPPRCPAPLHATRQGSIRSGAHATRITTARGWRAADDPAGDIVEVVFECGIGPRSELDVFVSTDGGVEIVETMRHVLTVNMAAAWLHELRDTVAIEGRRLRAAVPSIADAIIEFTASDAPAMRSE